MEAVILCGIQATGKSSFVKAMLYSSHVRLNLDMLRTRRREELLVRACIKSRTPFVVDNTNSTREVRARYIAPAKLAGFRIRGYYFESRVSDALLRNAARAAAEQVPEVGIRGTSACLQIPTRDEGFDELYYVRMTPSGFDVQEWKDEV